MRTEIQPFRCEDLDEFYVFLRRSARPVLGRADPVISNGKLLALWRLFCESNGLDPHPLDSVERLSGAFARAIQYLEVRGIYSVSEGPETYWVVLPGR